MFKVIIAVAIIILQLNLFYIVGCSLTAFFECDSTISICRSIAVGFVIYHAFFWLLSFPWSLADFPFSVLVYLWLSLLVLILIICFVNHRSVIIRGYKKACSIVKQYPFYAGSCFFFAFVILLIVICNGLIDIDSQTYIGEVTTILQTNHLSAFDPTTGLALPRQAFLHRGCSMFGPESAFWCRIFSVHPLIYCRITRAAMNPVLLLTGAYCILRLLSVPVKKAFLYIMFACPCMVIFDNSGYTNTRFLLRRGYEGKAYLSGTLIIFTVLLCLCYMKLQNNYSFVLLLANEIATLSISATALYIIPPLLVAVLGGFFLSKKKWRRIPLITLLVIPNIAFALLMLIG